MKTQVEIVRVLEKIRSTPDACGEIRALSTGEEFNGANLRHITIRGPTVPCYYNIITEFYFFIEGEGRIITGKESYEIRDGMLVIIPPNTAHCIIPRKVCRVLVFSVPAKTEQDQIILGEEDTAAHYSSAVEKFELIETLLSRKCLGLEKKAAQTSIRLFGRQRQDMVLRAGWAHMSIPELRKLLRIS